MIIKLLSLEYYFDVKISLSLMVCIEITIRLNFVYA